MFVNELTASPAQSLGEAPMLPSSAMFPSRGGVSAKRFAPSGGPGIVTVLCALLAAMVVYAAVYTAVVQLSTVVFGTLLRVDGLLILLEIDAGVLVCGGLVCAAALFWGLRKSRTVRDTKAALVESNVNAVTNLRFKLPIFSVSHIRNTVQHVGSDVRPRRPLPPSKIEAAR